VSALLTLGPLTFEPHNLFGTKTFGEDWPVGYISTVSGPQPVFELHVPLEYPREQLEAYAKLAAAAPDLLASVQELLAPLERASAEMARKGQFLNEAGESAFDRARAAIAKATSAG
jgi:hypothetical protein